MADPTKYVRGYSFTDFQTLNPTKPLPAVQVDNELENVEQSVGQIVDGLEQIRRSDGKLQNSIVTIESVAPGLPADLTALLTNIQLAAASMAGIALNVFYTPAAKGSLVDADQIAIINSAAGNSGGKITFGSLKTTLNATFGQLAAANVWAAAQTWNVASTMNAGLGFGSVFATTETTLTRHVSLYGATYGIAVTPLQMSLVAPLTSGFKLIAGGTAVFYANASGGQLNGSNIHTDASIPPATAPELRAGTVTGQRTVSPLILGEFVPRPLPGNTISANYTQQVSDFGCENVITFSTALVTLMAANAVRPGVPVGYRNASAGIVFITSPGADTVDGYAAAVPLLPGQTLWIYSDGVSAWRIFGQRPIQRARLLDTTGGATLAAAWKTRTMGLAGAGAMNSVPGLTISGGNAVLAASGLYRMRASAMVIATGGAATRIYNATTAASLGQSNNGFSNTASNYGNCEHSIEDMVVALAAGTTLRLETYAAAAQAVGLGAASGSGVEQYAEWSIERIGPLS